MPSLPIARIRIPTRPGYVTVLASMSPAKETTGSVSYSWLRADPCGQIGIDRTGRSRSGDACPEQLVGSVRHLAGINEPAAAGEVVMAAVAIGPRVEDAGGIHPAARYLIDSAIASPCEIKGDELTVGRPPRRRGGRSRRGEREETGAVELHPADRADLDPGSRGGRRDKDQVLAVVGHVGPEIPVAPGYVDLGQIVAVVLDFVDLVAFHEGQLAGTTRQENEAQQSHPD